MKPGTSAIIKDIARAMADAPWQALLDQHGHSMLRVAMAILHDRALAEDAVQEALVIIAEQAAHYKSMGDDPERAARAWILTITARRARNLQRGEWRRRRRERTTAEQVNHVDDDKNSETQHRAPKTHTN